MTLQRPLALTFTHQGESPHYVKGYLTVDGTCRLFPMTQVEAGALAEVVLATGSRKGAVLVWATGDDSRFSPFLSEAHRFSVTQGDDETATVYRYAVFREDTDEIALALRTVWNSYDNLDIVPADLGSSELIAEVVEECSNDADAARLGMDWQNRWYFRKNSGCLAILGFGWSTLGFLLKLLFSKGFRRELADPFRQVRNVSMTLRHSHQLFSV